jgi:methyl-accepting chemotaxis protein
MAEETTAVSHRLGEETKELIELISRFRVGENAGAAAARRAQTQRVAVAGGSAAVSARVAAAGSRKSRQRERAEENGALDWIEF